ncbi:MAG: DUF4440 domain-containing protein [Bacteroidia bacterium]
MKSPNFIPLFLFILSISSLTGYAQKSDDLNPADKQNITDLIGKYSQAREQSDTVLLKSILMPEVDQLVSSGEWRYGISGSMKGMMRSSAGNPGTRSLRIETIRFINPESAIVDARYEIQNPNGTARKMWSTFIVVYDKDTWKITAIRNMLPAGG